MDTTEKAESNGLLTAEGLIAGRRKLVETSRGKVQIRKLSLREVFVIKGSIVDVAGLAATEEEVEKMVRRADSKSANVMEAVVGMLRAGVVEPKLHDDPRDGPTADDFGFDDQMKLATDIMAFSGFSKEAGKDVRPS